MLIRVIMEIKRLIKKWGWMRWVNGVKNEKPDDDCSFSL